MMWDVEYTSDDGTQYRIQTKVFTVRDGLNFANQADEITNQFEGREMIEYSSFPVLKFGTIKAEKCLPESEEWLPMSVNTLDEFLDLDELLAFMWRDAIFAKNPQRFSWYENLKKSLAGIGVLSNQMPMPVNENDVNTTP